jgi:hypothetical protein
MQKLTFSTTINAPKEKVWRTMLDDATYRQWTSAFHEGSYAVTDWQEGSKALFLTPEGDGMVSKVITHRPNEYISVQHLGIVKKGVEDTESEEVKNWAGAMENYSIREANGSSTLTIEMDVTEDHKKYFEETWPKALSQLKQIAEHAQQPSRAGA